jgi:hypothetical protein
MMTWSRAANRPTRWPVPRGRSNSIPAKSRVSFGYATTITTFRGCFVPRAGEGLLVAGRCLSAEHEAMASARVTAQCFSYGQAVGMAAAMALHAGVSPRQLPAGELRDALRRDGAVL